jgi:hypothetical protein
MGRILMIIPESIPNTIVDEMLELIPSKFLFRCIYQDDFSYDDFELAMTGYIFPRRNNFALINGIAVKTDFPEDNSFEECDHSHREKIAFLHIFYPYILDRIIAKDMITVSKLIGHFEKFVILIEDYDSNNFHLDDFINGFIKVIDPRENQEIYPHFSEHTKEKFCEIINSGTSYDIEKSKAAHKILNCRPSYISHLTQT